MRDNVYDADERAACARKNFLDGYNCSQSVVMAYVDAFEQAGIDPELVARVASPFGGGMARMREVCGCVSGCLMIMGLVEGYSDPKAYAAKKRLYEQVQELPAATVTRTARSSAVSCSVSERERTCRRPSGVRRPITASAPAPTSVPRRPASWQSI